MSDEVTIVPAESRDLPAVAALAPEIWQYAYGDILSQEQIAYMLELMYAPEVLQADFDRGVKFRLIKCGERIVGFFSFFEYQKVPPVLKLDKLYLLPAFHGRGIGSLALRSLTECASDAGYGAIRLNVNKRNARAISAYTRNGFKKKESVKNDIGSGFFMDDYVMEKKLM
jgi:ribosomal protein S18 acetylase RimI-like enzyme